MLNKTFLTVIVTATCLYACDQNFDEPGAEWGVTEAALSAKGKASQPGDDTRGGDLWKPGDLCTNDGEPDSEKCKARNDCPKVTTDDGVTYEGVCKTIKKSDGKYLCACGKGKKVKKKKKQKNFFPVQVTEEDPTEKVLALEVNSKAEVGEEPVDLSFLLKPGNGKKCTNGGKPNANKCSARNDCPNVTTADGITYKGVCGTVKKADGKYTCKCGKGKKIKKKKKKPAVLAPARK